MVASFVSNSRSAGRYLSAGSSTRGLRLQPPHPLGGHQRLIDLSGGELVICAGGTAAVRLAHGPAPRAFRRQHRGWRWPPRPTCRSSPRSLPGTPRKPLRHGVRTNVPKADTGNAYGRLIRCGRRGSSGQTRRGRRGLRGRSGSSRAHAITRRTSLRAARRRPGTATGLRFPMSPTRRHPSHSQRTTHGSRGSVPSSENFFHAAALVTPNAQQKGARPGPLLRDPGSSGKAVTCSTHQLLTSRLRRAPQHKRKASRTAHGRRPPRGRAAPRPRGGHNETRHISFSVTPLSITAGRGTPASTTRRSSSVRPSSWPTPRRTASSISLALRRWPRPSLSRRRRRSAYRCPLNKRNRPRSSKT